MVVFITDASSTMGAAIARKFVQQGETVILSGQSEERLNMLAAELGPASIPVVAELKAGSSRDAVNATLPKGCHSIDVLVNTACMAAMPEPVSQIQPANFANALKTGTQTLLNTIRPILPFLKHQRGGRILNLTLADYVGLHDQPGTYGMAKIMLDNVTRILAEELVEGGIHTTCIVAGYNGASASPLNEKNHNSDAGRALTSADIAEAVYWVATQPSCRHVSHIELLPTDLPYAATHRQRR